MAITRTDRDQTYLNGVLVSDVAVDRDVTTQVNRAALSDLATLTARMTDLRDFLADPDVEFANNVANTTALTTQQQNRLNKAMIRQARRTANADLRLFRYVFGQLYPSLLADVSDV